MNREGKQAAHLQHAGEAVGQAADERSTQPVDVVPREPHGGQRVAAAAAIYTQAVSSMQQSSQTVKACVLPGCVACCHDACRLPRGDRRHSHRNAAAAAGAPCCQGSLVGSITRSTQQRGEEICIASGRSALVGRKPSIRQQHGHVARNCRYGWVVKHERGGQLNAQLGFQAVAELNCTMHTGKRKGCAWMVLGRCRRRARSWHQQ